MQEIQVGQTIYDFPDNMSDDEIARLIRQDMSGGNAAPPADNTIAASYTGGRGSVDPGPSGDTRPWHEALVQGAVDPLIGAARAVATPVANVMRDVMFSPGSTQGRVPAPVESNPVQPMVDAREAAIQQSRGNEAGSFDPMRMVGNVISPANVGPGKLAGAVAGAGRGMLRNIAGGAVGGAVGGAMAPSGDIGTNMALGSGLGGAGGAVTGAMGRMLSPKTNPDVKMLADAGVNPTIGKQFGKFGAGAEDLVIGSAPGPNLLRANRMGESVVEFNRAMYDKTLEPLGKKLSREIPVGSKAVAEVRNIISKAYDSAFEGVKGTMDEPLMRDLMRIGRKAQDELSESNADQYVRLIKSKVVSELKPGEIVSGDRLQAVPRTLRDITAKLNKGDFNDTQVADLLDEAGEAIKAMLERNNAPDALAKLRQVDRAYPMFKAISRATPGKVDDQGFTPSQMDTALRITDRSKDKMRYHEGGMQNQRFVQAANKVLPNIVPDSGTAVRNATNQITGLGPVAGGGAAGAAAFADPVTTAAVLGGLSLPYLPNVPSWLTSAMVRRPGFADPLAQKLSGAGLMATPGVGQAQAQ